MSCKKMGTVDLEAHCKGSLPVKIFEKKIWRGKDQWQNEVVSDDVTKLYVVHGKLQPTTKGAWAIASQHIVHTSNNRRFQLIKVTLHHEVISGRAQRRRERRATEAAA